MRRTCRTAIGPLLLALFLLTACGGRKPPPPTPTFTPRAVSGETVNLPTPYPAQTPLAGLPPAESFLPPGAWLAFHLEDSKGARWTVVAYGDRDEIVDEANNRKWVDRGAFLSRERNLWQGVLHQIGEQAFAPAAYLTACKTCPRMALAVRLGTSAQGVWVQSRPYDARGPLILLIPILQALRLRVERFMALYPSGDVISQRPLPTAPSSPSESEILRVIYGNDLQEHDGNLALGEGIEPWVAQVVPGAFTAHDARELAVLVGASGNEKTVQNIPLEKQKQLQPHLVILQKQRSGSWKVIARSEPLGMNVPREKFSMVIQSLSDFDHDGRQEILLTSASVLPRYLDGTHILYRWDQKQGNIRLVWTTTSYYDNTSLPQQPDYATQVAWPRWQDKNGDGVDELVLTTVRRTYRRQDPGFADTAHILRETQSEISFSWGGQGFLLRSP